MSDVDQRRFDNPPSDYCSADEAARFLGVQRRTLYAYASRGLLRSVPSGRGRARSYARSDLLRLKARHDARSGHGPVAASALLFGEPVLATRISAVDERGPVYRGIAALELASGRARFEEVAQWLWSGQKRPTMRGPRSGAAHPREDPPWGAESAMRDLGRVRAALDRLAPSSTRPARGDGRDAPFGRAPLRPVLKTMLLALASYAQSGAGEREEPDDLGAAQRIVFRLAVAAGLAWSGERAAAAARQPSIAAALSTALFAALGAKRRPAVERAIEAALVLSADHELNASTFAARVAASAGADLDACVIAALATLSGTKHGGMCDRVEALANEATGPARARSVVERRIGRGEEIPGFGHPLYPSGDPRGAMLVRMAAALSPRNRGLLTLRAIAEALRKLGGEPPTLDFGLVALACALGLPAGSASVLFAVGRAAGWIAHVFEQRRQNVLLRPRARYIGDDDSSLFG